MSWPEIALGEVADFIRGITFKPEDVIPVSSKDAVACLRTKNVQEDVEISDVWGIRARFVRRSEQYLKDGDILVSTANSWNLVGKCSWVSNLPWPATIGGFISALRASEKVDPRYLYHWFASGRVQADVRKCARKTTNISNLSFEQCLALQIPLPPLSEQRRIARVLDQADALRRLRRQSLSRLSDLGQAIFYEMFGDLRVNSKRFPISTLGEVADFYSGNSLPAGDEFSGQLDGHLLLKVSDLNHENNSRYIVHAAAWSSKPGSKSGTCPPQSVIFPKRGGAIATNKKRWLKRSAILDPNLMGVHPDFSILSMEFLFGWFSSFNLVDISSGSSVPQLNKRDLSPLALPIPPLEVQLRYGSLMAEMDTMRELHVEYVKGLDRSFVSLQHRAFRGEL